MSAATRPLNLVLEIKGYRGLDAQLKAETMRTLWVPGVNGLGAYGRWAFAEFREVFAIKDEFAALVDRLIGEGACLMARGIPDPKAGRRRCAMATTRRNIPTAEMQSFFQREEDHSPLPPKHYRAATAIGRGRTRASATPTATRS